MNQAEINSMRNIAVTKGGYAGKLAALAADAAALKPAVIHPSHPAIPAHCSAAR